MSEKLHEEAQLDEEILWKIKYDIYRLEEDNWIYYREGRHARLFLMLEKD